MKKVKKARKHNLPMGKKGNPKKVALSASKAAFRSNKKKQFS